MNVEPSLERLARPPLTKSDWPSQDPMPKFCFVCGSELVPELVFTGYNVYSGTITVTTIRACPSSRLTERVLAGSSGWAYASCQRWTDAAVQGVWTKRIAELNPETLDGRYGVNPQRPEGAAPRDGARPNDGDGVSSLGTSPALCGVPAVDQNKYSRTCRLLKGHDGRHACDDSPGTPTGPAAWTWENPGDVALREDRQVFFDLRDAAIG